MRQLQIDGSRALRPLVIVAVVIVAVGTSGCHWFSRKDALYQQSGEARPLEVRPERSRSRARPLPRRRRRQGKPVRRVSPSQAIATTCSTR